MRGGPGGRPVDAASCQHHCPRASINAYPSLYVFLIRVPLPHFASINPPPRSCTECIMVTCEMLLVVFEGSTSRTRGHKLLQNRQRLSQTAGHFSPSKAFLCCPISPPTSNREATSCRYIPGPSSPLPPSSLSLHLFLPFFSVSSNKITPGHPIFHFQLLKGLLLFNNRKTTLFANCFE